MKKTKKIKGILTIYIDVGQLPPFKAEAFMSNIKDNFNEDGCLDRLNAQGYEILWIPLRPNSETRVELLPLDNEVSPMIEVHAGKQRQIGNLVPDHTKLSSCKKLYPVKKS